VKDELHLKDYDLIMNRDGWERAFEALREDFRAASFGIRRDHVAAQLGVPRDWTWQDIHQYLEARPDSEDAFGALLAALYRAAPVDGVVGPETYIRGKDQTVYRRRKRHDKNE